MKKKNLRFFLGLYLAKTAYRLLRLVGKDASHFPGVVALKICPDFLSRVSAPETVVAVTGTNGKTTVTNMIYTLLKENGKKVLCNSLGSNTYVGISSVLVLGSKLSGKSKYPIAVLEVDERSSPLIYPYVKPTYLVCTNLFRDSLTRNAHTEFIKEILDKSIPKTITLVLNGDDLISSNLAVGNKRILFSIPQQSFEKGEEENLSVDLRVCPKCSDVLQYDFRRYHHIGKAHCPSCDFSTTQADYVADEIDMDKSQFVLSEPDGTKNTLMFPNKNIINIYNYVAAVSMARILGVSAENIKNSEISVVGSRYSEAKMGKKEALLTLSKAQNPIACSRAFSYAHTLSGKKSVVLFLDEIEDTDKSSENVCWMYDADFELLNSPDILQVIAVGARHLDDKVRLLMAGVPEDIIITTDDYSSVADLISDDADRIIVLYDLHCVSIAKNLKEKLTEKFSGGGI